MISNHPKPPEADLPATSHQYWLILKNSPTYAAFLVIFWTMLGCDKPKTKVKWVQTLYNIGSQSSPRTADLNGDGILDIVIGAAKNESQATDQGVLAFDGANGDLLWQQEAPDQVFGSATFHDVTNDGVPDVFIGGRSPNLRALDGKDGSTIWEYQYHYQEHPILRYARFNFYNSVLIPDQNQNQYPELLTVNGGNVKAVPHRSEHRYPGVLMLLDSKDGHIIAADTMPDGRESYMSPISHFQPGTGSTNVIFGSGGETISGNLYAASLQDFLNGSLHKARVIASDSGHGFIAPPVLADLTGDGTMDIITISHGGRIFAINGQDYAMIWHKTVEGAESSNALSVGYFNEDGIPDLFATLSKGTWPQSTDAVQLMINGSTGEIEFMETIGCVGFSSAVVYDLNHDGQDEAIISVNEYDCLQGLTLKSTFNIEHKLYALNFKDGSLNPIDRAKRFKNLFSTPWIGDLDGDHYLDIVHCQYYCSDANLLAFLGMNIKRISTGIKVSQPPLWGSYMGSKGNGAFTDQKNSD